MTRPTFLRVIPTRRPLACILHDWLVRAVLALLLLVALGYAFQAGMALWQVTR